MIVNLNVSMILIHEAIFMASSVKNFKNRVILICAKDKIIWEIYYEIKFKTYIILAILEMY